MADMLMLKEVGLHAVFPQPKGSVVYADLSDDISPLDKVSQEFLESRIRDALLSANEIAERVDHSSPVPLLVREFLTQKTNLLNVSRSLADALQKVQTGVTPRGILLVARASSANGEEALVIAKMEHERGVRAEATETEDGRHIYHVHHFRDLFMTTKTKVFKVAVFYKSGVSGTTFRGRLTDTQAVRREMAEYFLDNYLGCERAVAPEVQTRRFYEAIESFIKTCDPAKRASLHVALVSELKNNEPSVIPLNFASRYLTQESQDALESHLISEGASAEFKKDTALIDGVLNSMETSFANGCILYSPPDELGSTVLIDSDGARITSPTGETVGARKKLSPAKLLGT